MDSLNIDPPEAASIDEYNREKISEIVVQQQGDRCTLRVTDLREILFRMSKDAEISVPTSLMYRVLIELGIKIKGFHPNKTTLRETYKMRMDEINKILPGSYVRPEEK